MTAHHTLEALTGKVFNSKNQLSFRKALVVFQFGISIILITGIIILHHQVNHMQHKDLGINTDQMLILKVPITNYDNPAERYKSFKDELTKQPSIETVTALSVIPGRDIGYNVNFQLKGRDQVQKNSLVVVIDPSFIEAFGVSMLAGRNFHKNDWTNWKKILLNEKAAKLFSDDPESIVGKELIDGTNKKSYKVIGIMKDYHQKSLQHEIEPIVYKFNPASWGYFALKINKENYSSIDDIKGILTSIQATWQIVFDQAPFEYFFLNDFFDAQYQSIISFNKIISLFAVVFILISCLGLYGLSYYTVLKRTKEVGVRKVVGASTQDVLGLFLLDYAKYILIASIIAIPISVLLMQNWLQQYPYRIHIEYWHLLLPCFMVLIIALITVSVQTIKATLINPVEILRQD